MTTHYCPWDHSDTFAICGHVMTEADTHSPAPTCPACAVRLEAEDAAFAAQPLPLDAEEARDLDPLLNAGIPDAPTPTPRLQCADDLFAFAVALNRGLAEVLR